MRQSLGGGGGGSGLEASLVNIVSSSYTERSFVKNNNKKERALITMLCFVVFINMSIGRERFCFLSIS